MYKIHKPISNNFSINYLANKIEKLYFGALEGN